MAEHLREALAAPPDGGAAPTVVVAPPNADLGGGTPQNYVNLLAGGHGLQIEQTLPIRQSDERRNAVATTVRAFMDCLIEPADVSAGALIATGATYSADVAGYTGGACPRAMVEIAVRTTPTLITGEGATCAAGARAHVDVFRRRGDFSFQRVGGGYRVGVQGANGCAWSDETGYETPSGAGVTPGVFRVVVRASDADGSTQSARVRASS